MKSSVLFACTVLWVSMVSGFGGTEDRFVKKYAMMKIYESCFGPEVVRQIRKEMKAACTKCSSYEAPASITAAIPSTTTTASVTTTEKSTMQSQSPQDPAAPGNVPNVDIDRTNQAFLAFKPNSPQQQSANFRPPMSYNNFYSPMAFNPNYQGQGGFPFFYPGYQQVPFSPYGNYPIVAPPQFYNRGSRMSRDMDISGQIDAIASKMNGKVRNVTCVMQELGYLDNNLDPNFSRISERIGHLPIDEELKRDMQDGVEFCKQFSTCVPEVTRDKSPLSRELIRPVFFFKCYKHKKLEACIMKDVREKYAGVSEDEFDGGEVLTRQGRHGKAAKIGLDEEKEIDDMAASMYEFLYASDSGFEIDSIL